ncbi:uncharacterized protein LOC144641063 isoform X1 [Oculina patagonica]
MKSLLICVFLILTSLGFSSASGNTDKKGVHVVDNTPDSFRQRIIIDENLSQRNVVIEIDFISVKMLVTLRLDTKNMNTVTTTLLHGKSSLRRPENRSEKQSTRRKELPKNCYGWIDKTWNTLYEMVISLFGWTELPKGINTNIFNWRSVTMSAEDSTFPGDATEIPVKEHDKDYMENLGRNQTQGGSADKTSRSGKQSIRRKEFPTNKRLSWMNKTWNTLYEVIISLFGWTQLPHNINTNIFNWRSVTMSAVHSTHPGHATEEPVKEHGKDYMENLGTNQVQGGSADKSSRSGKQSTPRKVLPTNKRPSWMDKTWHTLYEVMISLFGWTQLPHNINTNIFNWRSVTMSAVHSTHPGHATEKPVKEHDEDYMDNLGTNQAQVGLADQISRSGKQSIRRKELSTNKRPSWTDNTWHTLYEVMISLFGWTQLPHNINTNIFNWRSVTMSAVHSTHPGHATATPVKEHDEDYMENLGTNQAQDANKRPSWTDNTWNTLYEVIISLFGWTQLPHNINTNIFNWRSVTMSAVHSTHPGHATEKPVKEHDEDYMENLGPNQAQGANKKPSWMNNTWHTLYEVIISLFGWAQLPNDINTNIFNWRSVTMSAVHSTHPGDAKLERWAHSVTTSPSDISWSFSTVSAATKLWYKCMAGIQRFLSSQICYNARNLIHDYWTNWTWRDTFDVMIISWMINFCAIALYFTIHFTGKIIRLKGLQYAIERERLRELELARERAAQLKPWRPKPKKKRRKKQGEW